MIIRVLVIAGSTAARTGMEALVSASPALELAGGSGDLAALPELVEELRPDVVLVELERADQESFASSLQLLMGADRAHRPGDSWPASTALSDESELALSHFPAAVVLADDPQGRWVREVLRSGARAVLPRTSRASEITAAIEAAAAGLLVVHPGAAEGLLAATLATPRAAREAPLQTLTAREVEVLGMLAEGLGNKEIAWRLKISEHTVKFHISSIFTKLGVSSRTEAVTLGIRQGLVML
jgi:DNA-binding NarL/FixJ family response regulator